MFAIRRSISRPRCLLVFIGRYTLSVTPFEFLGPTVDLASPVKFLAFGPFFIVRHK